MGYRSHMPRRRATSLLLLLTALAWGGCDGFDLVSKTALLAPGSPEEGKKFLVEALNYWVGRSKDERVRAFGAPVRCQKLETAEVCEWKTTRQLVAFNYDAGGIARSWSYRGEYGQFTKANHQGVKLSAAPSEKTARARQKSATWVHPSKGKPELDQDYYECRGLIEKDPKLSGANFALGKDFISAEEMAKCLKQRGWTQE